MERVASPGEVRTTSFLSLPRSRGGYGLACGRGSNSWRPSQPPLLPVSRNIVRCTKLCALASRKTGLCTKSRWSLSNNLARRTSPRQRLPRKPASCTVSRVIDGTAGGVSRSVTPACGTAGGISRIATPEHGTAGGISRRARPGRGTAGGISRIATPEHGTAGGISRRARPGRGTAGRFSRHVTQRRGAEKDPC